MDYKKTNADQSIVTRDIRNFDGPTGNLYEAIAIMSKRANQISSEIKEELTSKLQEFRRKYGIPEQDFHVTLGFKWKDVFGVRKNVVLKEKEPFLKLLRDLYYKNHETFEFVKEIVNFDGDPEMDIEPIEILDTTATFRNGQNDYFSISLLDNGLRVVAEWQDTEKRPILANTLISKKFKDI